MNKKEKMRKADAIVQFISSENEEMTHLESIEKALDAGVKWIQLRIKNKSEDEVISIAEKVLDLCKKHDAKLIINDYPHLVNSVGADGVHLGKKDMNLKEAREIVGTDKIIGGTANTEEDVVSLAQFGVDYIGLGPFKFTTTKKELSPILGAEGIREIIETARKNNIKTPIVAIGGIQSEDIETVFDAGVDGIAVSSGIISDENPEKFVEKVIDYKKNKNLKKIALC